MTNPTPDAGATWSGVRELHPAVLASRLHDGEPLVVIDVREEWEWDLVHVTGAQHIPLGTIPRVAATLDPAAETVLVCHHGARSLSAARFLASQGFTRLWNLSGGIERYALEGDTTLARY